MQLSHILAIKGRTVVTAAPHRTLVGRGGVGGIAAIVEQLAYDRIGLVCRLGLRGHREQRGRGERDAGRNASE